MANANIAHCARPQKQPSETHLLHDAISTALSKSKALLQMTLSNELSTQSPTTIYHYFWVLNDLVNEVSSLYASMATESTPESDLPA